MNVNTLLQLLVVSMRILGALIVTGYYWLNHSIASIKHLPTFLLLVALSYILLQIITRNYIRRDQRRWFDWLYYLGLLSMLLPMFFVEESTIWFFNRLTDIGTLVLLIPPLFDLKLLTIKS